MTPPERRGLHPGRRKPAGVSRAGDAARVEASPEQLADRLDEGLHALGMTASARQRDRLLAYLALLSKWNATYNLTAVRDPLRMVSAHLLDCLAALPVLEARLGGRVPRILDVGSGAGLPGIVWAVMLEDTHHGLRLVTVDAVEKKIAFQRQAQAALGLANLECLHARVESLDVPGFGIVTSRAYSALDALIEGTRHLLAPGGLWLALKGEPPMAEIAALPDDVRAVGVERLHVPLLDDAARSVVLLEPLA